MFKGEMFLAVASDVVQLSDEAAWRTAISRAYYAAFWVAREVIESGNVRTPQAAPERSHDNMWDMLVGDFNKQGDSLGELGRDLKQSRVKADYRTRSITQNEARKVVADATRLVADLRTLTASPTDTGNTP